MNFNDNVFDQCSQKWMTLVLSRKYSVGQNINSVQCRSVQLFGAEVSGHFGNGLRLKLGAEVSCGRSVRLPSFIQKQGWCGENTLFSSFMRLYLEKGRRYVQSYY